MNGLSTELDDRTEIADLPAVAGARGPETPGGEPTGPVPNQSGAEHDERRDARRAALAALASRLVAFAAAFGATYWLGARFYPRRVATPADLLAHHPLSFLIGAWDNFDGHWFIRIATHGYEGWRAAFFPLYPLLVHLGTEVVRKVGVSGILVSLICYALAMVVLYRLVKADLGSRVALWSVVLLSFAPTAFFFQAVYSESLFLLLTLLSFGAGRNGRWLLAGVSGLLAALTRSAGVVLLLPLAWMWLEQRRGRPLALPGGKAGLVEVPGRPAHLASLACLLLVPAGVGIYMAYTWARFHDALLFVAAERHWHRHLSSPTTALIHGTRAMIHSVRAIAADPHAYFVFARPPFRLMWLTVGNLTAFVALVVALVLLVLCWRRLPASYTLFAIATLLLPLSYPSRGIPLLSMPRFVLVDFPLFVALACVLVPHRVTRWAILAVMAVLMVVLTATYAMDMWVA